MGDCGEKSAIIDGESGGKLLAYLRFFRRVHLAPGLSLNLSKSGPSLSLGARGAHVTFGPTGVRKTVGLPGSGVFFTSHEGWHSGAHTAPNFAETTPAPASPRSGWQQAGYAVLQIAEFAGLALLAVLAVLLALVGAAAGPSRHHH